MNDDLDLSFLLGSPPEPPANGASRVKEAVTRRNRRRQIGASVLGGIAMVAAGTGISYAALDGGDNEVVISREAADIATTTTTSSTTSTTVPADPRAKYIGLEHTYSGSGLPVDVEIRTSGALSEVEETFELGDKLLFHTRDPLGDMLWLEEVTDAGSPGGSAAAYRPSRSRVLAVFDVPKLKETQYFCIGYCGVDNKTDYKVVGLVDNEKVTKAWRVDVTKRTLTSISTSGVTPYVDTVAAIDLPARPELYYFLAGANEEQAYAVNSRENVMSTGGYNRVNFMLDSKENKRIAVFRDGDKRGLVEVDGVDGSFSNGWSYKGEINYNAFVYERSGGITGAWLLDTGTGKFTPIPLTDMSRP